LRSYLIEGGHPLNGHVKIGGSKNASLAVLSAAMGAAMALYFVAIIAAVHRQLAGPSPEATAGLFD